MKATALFLTLALIASSGTSAHATGVNLSWDDCGSAGTENKVFACDTNTGAAFIVVGSFVAPGGSTAITGMEVSLDFASVGPSLSDWWQFKNAGTCRQTALTTSADFISGGYASCADYWAGQAFGGITQYDWPYSGSNCHSRLRFLFAQSPDLIAPLEEGLEYYAFRISISRAATVGPGSCAGCIEPIGLLLNEIKLTQPAGIGNYRLQNPQERYFVGWQGSAWNTCFFVPTRNTTWGAVKSLYR